MDVTQSDGAHLQPAVQGLLDLPDEQRIRRIRMDRWIGYPRAQAALETLQSLLAHPKRLRMPNLMLVGSSNNGKSMILEKFCRAHARASEEGAMNLPILRIQMPAQPDEKHFFGEILVQVGTSRCL